MRWQAIPTLQLRIWPCYIHLIPGPVRFFWQWGHHKLIVLETGHTVGQGSGVAGTHGVGLHFAQQGAGSVLAQAGPCPAKIEADSAVAHLPACGQGQNSAQQGLWCASPARHAATVADGMRQPIVLPSPIALLEQLFC